MFGLTYLRRELRRRAWQSLLCAAALAVAIALAVTVAALSDGVARAQAGALRSFYGAGTDLTVTREAVGNPNMGPYEKIFAAMQSGTLRAGQTITADGLVADGAKSAMAGTGLAPIEGGVLPRLSAIDGVRAAAGGIIATNIHVVAGPASAETTGPGWMELGGGLMMKPTVFQVAGVDPAHPALGPLGAGRVTAGRTLGPQDTARNVAVVGSGYAAQNRLAPGSRTVVAGTAFEVVGVVTLAQGARPADVYIPLGRAQRLSELPGQINSVYLDTGPGAAGPVGAAVRQALPGAVVTSGDSMAGEISGSLSTARDLVRGAGRWSAGIALVLAFALAALLTLGAVARRSREFGMLKALGWRGGRIVRQLVGEAAVVGLLAAVLGVGLSAAAVGIVEATAPELSAVLPGGDAADVVGPADSPLVRSVTGSRNIDDIRLSAELGGGSVAAAVLLAFGGAAAAGALGGWRASSVAPAVILRRVD